MTNFEATLKARMKEENTNATFPITMGINAFRGFLDEFHKKKETKESKETEVRVNRKEKKRKDKEVITVRPIFREREGGLVGLCFSLLFSFDFEDC